MAATRPNTGRSPAAPDSPRTEAPSHAEPTPAALSAAAQPEAEHATAQAINAPTDPVTLVSAAPATTATAAPPAPAAPPPTPSHAPATPPQTPPPTAQVATALADSVQFTITPSATPGAAQTVTIQLKPVELGRVEVRIERSAEGHTKVELAVERTDTLMTLVRDQPQLHQALDQAGVPQEGRTVQFSLASDTPSTPNGTTFGAGLLGDGSPSSGGGGGGQRSAYQQGGGHHGGHDSEGPHTYPIWTRSGIDITA